jgi:RNA recognition motif-containing protein
LRKAGEDAWVDPTLEDWNDNDYRIFCGNMGNEVTDDVLANAFRKYASFSKARVVRDKKTLKSKGFGFVSLLHVDDYIKAMREMQGKYVGNRPITLKRSDWQKKSAL